MNDQAEPCWFTKQRCSSKWKWKVIRANNCFADGTLVPLYRLPSERQEELGLNHLWLAACGNNNVRLDPAPIKPRGETLSFTPVRIRKIALFILSSLFSLSGNKWGILQITVPCKLDCKHQLLGKSDTDKHKPCLAFAAQIQFLLAMINRHKLQKYSTHTHRTMNLESLTNKRLNRFVIHFVGDIWLLKWNQITARCIHSGYTTQLSELNQESVVWIIR